MNNIIIPSMCCMKLIPKSDGRPSHYIDTNTCQMNFDQTDDANIERNTSEPLWAVCYDNTSPIYGLAEVIDDPLFTLIREIMESLDEA